MNIEKLLELLNQKGVNKDAEVIFNNGLPIKTLIFRNKLILSTHKKIGFCKDCGCEVFPPITLISNNKDYCYCFECDKDVIFEVEE